jgi:hypothetical protein
LDACRVQAEALIGAGRKWHSHVFSPGCVQNPFDGVYAIVVEDDSSMTPYIAKGTYEFPDVDKELVKLLHGNDILDAAKATGGSEVAKTSLLLAHIMRLQEGEIAWHHHMHFPACAFNPMPGRWSISVEGEGSFFAESFDSEPVDILREVEVIYFGNLERKQANGHDCGHH